jgi:hypothetical protein
MSHEPTTNVQEENGFAEPMETERAKNEFQNLLWFSESKAKEVKTNRLDIRNTGTSIIKFPICGVCMGLQKKNKPAGPIAIIPLFQSAVFHYSGRTYAKKKEIFRLSSSSWRFTA